MIIGPIMINNYIIYSVYSVLWIRRSFIRCQQSHSSFKSQHRVKLSDIMIQADFPGNPGIERIIYFRCHSSSLMRDHQKLMSKLKPESRCSFHFALLCLSSCGTRTLGRPAPEHHGVCRWIFNKHTQLNWKI